MICTGVVILSVFTCAIVESVYVYPSYQTSIYPHHSGLVFPLYYPVSPAFRGTAGVVQYPPAPLLHAASYSNVKSEKKVDAKYYYGGHFKGTCSIDGLYYKDDTNFVICSNGYPSEQPCPAGTKTSGSPSYQAGYYYGHTDLCSVNLVDYRQVVSTSSSSASDTVAAGAGREVKDVGVGTNKRVEIYGGVDKEVITDESNDYLSKTSYSSTNKQSQSYSSPSGILKIEDKYLSAPQTAAQTGGLYPAKEAYQSKDVYMPNDALESNKSSTILSAIGLKSKKIQATSNSVPYQSDNPSKQETMSKSTYQPSPAELFNRAYQAKRAYLKNEVFKNTDQNVSKELNSNSNISSARADAYPKAEALVSAEFLSKGKNPNELLSPNNDYQTKINPIKEIYSAKSKEAYAISNVLKSNEVYSSENGYPNRYSDTSKEVYVNKEEYPIRNVYFEKDVPQIKDAYLTEEAYMRETDYPKENNYKSGVAVKIEGGDISKLAYPSRDAYLSRDEYQNKNSYPNKDAYSSPSKDAHPSKNEYLSNDAYLSKNAYSSSDAYTNPSKVEYLSKDANLRKNAYAGRDTFSSKGTYGSKDAHPSRNTYSSKDAYPRLNKDAYSRKNDYLSRDAYSNKDDYLSKDASSSKDAYLTEDAYKGKDAYLNKDASSSKNAYTSSNEEAYPSKDAYVRRDAYLSKDTYLNKDAYPSRVSYPIKESYEIKEAYPVKDEFSSNDAYASKDEYSKKDAYLKKDASQTNDAYIRKDAYASEDAYTRKAAYPSTDIYLNQDAYPEENSHLKKDAYIIKNEYTSKDSYLSSPNAQKIKSTYPSGNDYPVDLKNVYPAKTTHLNQNVKVQVNAYRKRSSYPIHSAHPLPEGGQSIYVATFNPSKLSPSTYAADGGSVPSIDTEYFPEEKVYITGGGHGKNTAQGYDSSYLPNSELKY